MNEQIIPLCAKCQKEISPLDCNIKNLSKRYGGFICKECKKPKEAKKSLEEEEKE